MYLPTYYQIEDALQIAVICIRSHVHTYILDIVVEIMYRRVGIAFCLVVACW